MFALINRPEIFDLRPGSSLVEYLIGEGFDVFLVDWGVSGRGGRATWDSTSTSATSSTGRCARRCAPRGAEELTLMGWCIGATLCAMYCGLDRGAGAHR